MQLNRSGRKLAYCKSQKPKSTRIARIDKFAKAADNTNDGIAPPRTVDWNSEKLSEKFAECFVGHQVEKEGR